MPPDTEECPCGSGCGGWGWGPGQCHLCLCQAHLSVSLCEGYSQGLDFLLVLLGPLISCSLLSLPVTQRISGVPYFWLVICARLGDQLLSKGAWPCNPPKAIFSKELCLAPISHTPTRGKPVSGRATHINASGKVDILIFRKQLMQN